MRSDYTMNQADGSGALGILAGGGPAPGINAVISAATIRARLQGIEVHGILDGFGRLIHGAEDATRQLDIDDVELPTSMMSPACTIEVGQCSVSPGRTPLVAKRTLIG